MKAFIGSLIAAAGFACPVHGIASASNPPDDVEDLRRTIEELRQQVAVIPDLQRELAYVRSGQDDQWLTERRAAELRGLVQDVLADADTRASLLGSALTAGWDNGFHLASADGNNFLRIGGQLQIRFVYNNQRDSPEDDHRWGFENRRTRLLFSGHVINPSWTYDIQLAVDRDGGIMRLEDAGWIQKDLGGGLRLRAGQMKAPFMREELLSSIRMLAVERSLLNAQFTAGLVRGVMAWWGYENLRLYGMVHNRNRSGNAGWETEGSEFAASARAEWLVFGQWGNFIDYASFRDQESGLLIGAAINYSKDEHGTPTPDELRNVGLTADITADFGGLNLSGVFVYRNLHNNMFDRDQFGFLVRSGFFLTDNWELFAMYEWGDLDTPGVPDLRVLTAGVTHYWAKHRLKWTSDIGYSFNTISSEWSNAGAGWRTDSPGNDGQIVFRSQLQIMF